MTLDSGGWGVTNPMKFENVFKENLGNNKSTVGKRE